MSSPVLYHLSLAMHVCIISHILLVKQWMLDMVPQRKKSEDVQGKARLQNMVLILYQYERLWGKK